MRKDNYYENYVLEEDGNIIILVDLSKVNKINDSGVIIINGIKDYYSIIKIHKETDICMIYLKLKTNIENINKKKYQILLGKETIIEYIIKTILE